MNGYLVSDGESWVLVRAPNAKRARTFWPGQAEPGDLTVRRERWLDGGTEEVRHVDPVYERCEAEGDEYGGCFGDHYLCWEGLWVSQTRTAWALAETTPQLPS